VSGLKISVRSVDEIKILDLVGSLDTQTFPLVEEELSDLIAGGARKILVNFGRLDYISSAGLRILLVAAKQLHRHGGEIQIFALNELVREVFDISGFATIFKVSGTEQDGLNSF
jgi:anti-sigma B factor antagonist